MTAINWQWRAFDELSAKELYAMYRLRQDVFIVEQDCVYPDIDGKDPKAIHLLGWDGDKLIATLRLFEHYDDYDGAISFGRVCTEFSARKTGIGKSLLAETMSYIDNQFPNRPVQIGAQVYLKRFYQGYGFEQVSDIYDEDGIDHILMKANG
jgi:ElaA protein